MREIPEWIGKTDDTPIPDRVKRRICQRQGFACVDCGRPFSLRCKAEMDHRPPLWADGENRESKIVAACSVCHSAVTQVDATTRAKRNHRQIKEKIKTEPSQLAKAWAWKKKILAERRARDNDPD